MTMAAATKGVRELEDRGRRHSQRPVAGPAGLAQQFRDIGEPGAGRLSSRLPAGPGSRTNPPAPPARRLGTAVGFAGVTPRAGCGRRRSGGGPPGSGGGRGSRGKGSVRHGGRNTEAKCVLAAEKRRRSGGGGGRGVQARERSTEPGPGGRSW